MNSPGEEKSVVVAGTSLSPDTVMGSNPNLTVVSAVRGGVRSVTVNAPTADPVVDAGEAGGKVANPIVDVGKVTQSVAMTGQLIDAILDNVPKGLASGRASGRKKMPQYQNLLLRLSRGYVQYDGVSFSGNPSNPCCSMEMDVKRQQQQQQQLGSN